MQQYERGWIRFHDVLPDGLTPPDHFDRPPVGIVRGQKGLTMVKKPAECVTPKRDRDEYVLTSKDIGKLKKHVKAAIDILEYYELMPENHTGVLYYRKNKGDSFMELYSMAEDLLNYLVAVNEA